MQSDEVEGRGEQVTPPEAPKDGPLDSSENAGQEDCRTCVVGEVRAPCDLVQSPRGDACARQAQIQLVYAKRDRFVPHAHALDLRDARS